MERYGWKALFTDGTIIAQFPDEETDNTLRLKEIYASEEVKQFILVGEGNKIGIDLQDRYLIIGDLILPFFSHDEKLKLVYFMTRTVVSNVANVQNGSEQPRIHTLGYEDGAGKLFLSLEEDSGAINLSTDNP